MTKYIKLFEEFIHLNEMHTIKVSNKYLKNIPGEDVEADEVIKWFKNETGLKAKEVDILEVNDRHIILQIDPSVDADDIKKIKGFISWQD